MSAQIEMTVVEPGTQIPDGTHFISTNGVHCYKLPKATFDQALAFGSRQGLASVAQYSDEKLTKALAWALARLDEKTEQIYMIMPVSKAKQHVALGMYRKALWAFRKAVEAEQIRRTSDVAFGA